MSIRLRSCRRRTVDYIFYLYWFQQMNICVSGAYVARVDSPARNLVEAASSGAISAIEVVASVAANLIAILGLITFLNAALSYLGGCVGVYDLTFEVRRYYERFIAKICSTLTCTTT